MDDDAAEDSRTSLISRRRLIKAGAVVGGAAWVAPVVDSFVTAAAAASPAFPFTYKFDLAYVDGILQLTLSLTNTSTVTEDATLSGSFPSPGSGTFSAGFSVAPGATYSVTFGTGSYGSSEPQVTVTVDITVTPQGQPTFTTSTTVTST